MAPTLQRMEREGCGGLVLAITGANKGLGLAAVTALARTDGVAKVVLLCRSASRADAAVAQVKASGARAELAVVVMDCCSLDSCRAAVGALQEACGGAGKPLDGLLLNAGGVPPGGPSTFRKPLPSSKCSEISTVNVIGHAALLEGLAAAGCPPARVVLSGSEAAHMARFAEPTADCVHEELTQPTGGGGQLYGGAKAIGALYIAAFARRHPSLRAYTVSPGGTYGTAAFDALPACMPCLCDTLFMPCRWCLCHAPEVGAQRYVEALLSAEYPYASGAFVGGRLGITIGHVHLPEMPTGPTADQAALGGKTGAALRERLYGNAPLQEAAYEAVLRVLGQKA